MEHARMLHQQMCAAVLEDSHTLHSIYRTAPHRCSLAMPTLPTQPMESLSSQACSTYASSGCVSCLHLSLPLCHVSTCTTTTENNHCIHPGQRCTSAYPALRTCRALEFMHAHYTH